MDRREHEESLDKILSSIRVVMNEPGGQSEDVVRLRSDADRAARLVIDLYGKDAVHRARRLENLSSGKLFARMVRERVEKAA